MKDGMRFVDCDMHIMEPRTCSTGTWTPSSRTESLPWSAQTAPLGPLVYRRHTPVRGHRAFPVPQTHTPNTADTSILGPSLGNLTSSRLIATGRMDSPWTASTTRKPRSWRWRWRGSISPSSSPPRASTCWLETTWTPYSPTPSAGPITTGFTSSARPAPTN